MAELWCFIVVGCLVTYAVLDGFDLGAGIVHYLVARGRSERRVVLASVGPVWDGNEVWLIALGGSLFFAFPSLYAWTLSGFYLPVTLVLWLLVGRALGIELKHHGTHPLWSDFWDFAFAASSAALSLLFGVLVGNLVRGVRVGTDGFFLPLFTDFTTSGDLGVFDWYTLLWGLVAVAVFALHGALWVAHRTRGEVASRAVALAKRLLPIVFGAAAITALASVWVQPVIADNVADRPYLAIGFALPILALWRVRAALAAGAPKDGFLASIAFVASGLACVVVVLAPYLLVAPRGAGGLTVRDVALEPSSLAQALWWFVPGVALVIGYFVFMYRTLPETVGEEDVAEEH